MPTLTAEPTGVRGTAATASPSRSRQKREEALCRAQGERLDQELAQRKALLAQLEKAIAIFKRVYPLLEKKGQVFVDVRARLQKVRCQLEAMRAQENAELSPLLRTAQGTSGTEALLRANLKKASANHAYFEATGLFQIVLPNLHGLFQKLAADDPRLKPHLDPAAEAIMASWRAVEKYIGQVVVRRSRLAETTPTPAEMESAGKVWQTLLARNPGQAYLHGLAPHAARHGPTRIAYISVGGLGDALLQTPLLAAIKRRFSPCEILVIHSRSVVHPLFAGNRTVDGTAFAEDTLVVQMPQALQGLGIFDLVLETRFIVWGMCPWQSRLTAEADLKWVRKTQEQLEPYGPFLDRFPHYGNLFGRLVAPDMLLDVHGRSSGLPVSVHSPLYFALASSDADVVSNLGLVPNDYVTVHDGFDESFGKMMGITRCTKQLPAEKWRTIINGVRAQGLKIVQVGAPNEPLLAGVDLDLRGKTTLSELGFVLKSAAVHVDTEGGIVHFARAVQKRSIVFFGPTSVSFWGHPANLNLCSEEYADHWWIHPDWMARAPIAQRQSAMEAFDVSGIAELVKKERNANLARQYRVSAVQTQLAPEASVDGPVELALRRLAPRLPGAAKHRVLVIEGGAESFSRAIEAAPMQVDRINVDPQYAYPTDVPRERLPMVGSLYNLPVNSEQYDAVVVAGALDGLSSRAAALRELFRTLKVDGTLLWYFTPSTFGTVAPEDGLAASLGSLVMNGTDTIPVAEIGSCRAGMVMVDRVL